LSLQFQTLTPHTGFKKIAKRLDAGCHLYDALGQDRLRRERVGWFHEVAAKTLQERPGFIERIANRACLAKSVASCS
jgi:hypothetical protein